MNTEQKLATMMSVKELIQDLVNTGMSYARISMRLGLSPSTIQKIVAKNRLPRAKTLMDIVHYYLKIFTSPHSYGEWVLSYFNQHQNRIQANILKAKHLLLNLSRVV